MNIMQESGSCVHDVYQPEAIDVRQGIKRAIVFSANSEVSMKHLAVQGLEVSVSIPDFTPQSSLEPGIFMGSSNPLPVCLKHLV